MGRVRISEALRRSGPALSAILFLVFCAACTPAGDETRRSPPESPAQTAAATKLDVTPGLKEIAAGRAAALLHVPEGYRPDKPMPLVVMLHGAGGSARHGIDLARSLADELGFLLLAPKSRGVTWDIIAERRFGADAAALDAFVAEVTGAYAVDRQRIAVAGFSDGASYALSVGLERGDTFSDIIAFSPGFMAPGRASGQPAIFISHGMADRVLPIDSCSRRLVPRLEQAGYSVRYIEFPGGHVVPPELARQALEALVGDGASGS
jgi:predicted esterase